MSRSSAHSCTFTSTAVALKAVVGVSTSTLRRWADNGLVGSVRLNAAAGTGARRYCGICVRLRVGLGEDSADGLSPGVTLCYARVSRQKQKKAGDLARHHRFSRQIHQRQAGRANPQQVLP